MRDPRQVIVRPIVTEKTTALSEALNTYVFIVSKNANKIEIRRSIEQLFDVEVAGVRTMVYRGKERRIGRHIGRKASFKKAVVTLAEGAYIDLYEGV